MLPAEILKLPGEFLARAENDGAHDRVAGLVWRQAAEIARSALDEALSESLTVTQAAAEYGWNPEALRRRVSADPSLNAGAPGRPRVTRATMQSLGPGRGSRSAPDTETPQAAEPAPSRLEEIRAIALQGRRGDG